MPAYSFPADLEELVRLHAGVPEDEFGIREMARAVTSLSDRFVGRAAWRPDYMDDRDLRRGYLAYFLPVSFAKVRGVVATWLATSRGAWARPALRCLDLGAGGGAGLLAVCDLTRSLPAPERPGRLELVAVDESSESLRDAAALVHGFASADPDLPRVGFEALRLDAISDRAQLVALAAAGGRFDIVLASNVLCEIARESKGLDWAAGLFLDVGRDLLDLNGALVLIEPALHETSRDLERLRDHLLASGELHVHAPCLHAEACPALRTDRDWCVSDVPWQPPEVVRTVDRLTGLDKKSLKFSYLVLSRELPAPNRPGIWRAVSDPLELKGEVRIYLCGEGRWIVLRELKRTRSRTEAVLRSLRRGDLVEIDGLEARGTLFQIAAGGSIKGPI